VLCALSAAADRALRPAYRRQALQEEIPLALFQGGVSQMLPSILFMKLDFCFLLRVGIPLRLGVFARRKP